MPTTPKIANPFITVFTKETINLSEIKIVNNVANSIIQ